MKKNAEPPRIPRGWTRSAFVHHLRKQADYLDFIDDRRAAQNRKWADLIEAAGDPSDTF